MCRLLSYNVVDGVIVDYRHVLSPARPQGAPVTADPLLIRSEGYAEIGALIQRDATLLIDRWSQRAALEQPGAARLHHRRLRDHLSVFLVELARHLAQASDQDSCPHYLTARQHGEQRWEDGWSLTEVVRDYRILRLVILEHLDEALPRPLRLREVQAVGLALDDAIEASIERYVSSREEFIRQQAETLQLANQRKDQFLATLAHELRNPLASLRNSLEVVRISGGSADAFTQMREIMDRQTLQMTRLVEDLLDVTRIAQGKLVLRKDYLDIRHVVEQAVQMNAPLRQARHQQLSVSLPAAPLWFEGDQARLVQVVVNLLNNAVKYTPDAGRIDLTAEQEGNETIIRVKDTGVGIPPDKLAHVFDLFAQLDLGPERARDGLGIGLTLVRRLVEIQGGKITAASAGVWQGSEFVVRLPSAAPPPSTPENRSRIATAVKGRHLLIIEDNADARDALATLLRLLGHRVDVAADGLSGLALALSVRPEIGLIDLGLPKMDGYEVARRLRQELGNDVKLIALTGHSQPEDRQRSQEAGFNAHLIKPIELESLVALM
jgi:signal transduction histidine kinase